MLLKYAACKFWPFCYGFLLKLEYFGQTRSILWQLISWLLTFPGHHQPCYWLGSTGHCFPWGKILMAWTISKLRNCTTCKYVFMFPKMNSAKQVLTDWGWVTPICIGKPTIIGSDNGLSPGRCQAIIGTNAVILLIGPLGTNFSEILIEILTFSFKKMSLKVSSAKWRPFCLGLNVLNTEIGLWAIILHHWWPAVCHSYHKTERALRSLPGHHCWPWRLSVWQSFKQPVSTT